MSIRTMRPQPPSFRVEIRKANLSTQMKTIGRNESLIGFGSELRVTSEHYARSNYPSAQGGKSERVRESQSLANWNNDGSPGDTEVSRRKRAWAGPWPHCAPLKGAGRTRPDKCARHPVYLIQQTHLVAIAFRNHSGTSSLCTASLSACCR